MNEDVKQKVKEILDGYLDTNQHRKTPERYAILDAVYSIGGHFSLEELGELLEKRHFRVSRATLYNTIHLFVELRLVIRHGLANGTKYEACYDNENHVHQVCTVCGRVTELEAPLVMAAVAATKLQRFRRDAFALYIYGVCSSCQAKITRRRTQQSKKNSNETTYQISK